jgi:hypothetical protein
MSQMGDWEKDFSKIKMLVIFVYGSIAVYAVMVQALPISIPNNFPPDFIFHALLAAAGAGLAVPLVLIRVHFGERKIEEKRLLPGPPERRVDAALATVRCGALISAAAGETGAVFGVFYYFLTGDKFRPWLFFLLGGCNYFVTSRYLQGAHESVLKVSRGY